MSDRVVACTKIIFSPKIHHLPFAKMTDQPSPQTTSDSSRQNIHPTTASGGPSLPRFRPLPSHQTEASESNELLDDEPSPFISDRLKSGHLGKSEMPKDAWIWATVALVLLGLAVFGLAQRANDTPSEVQIVEPES